MNDKVFNKTLDGIAECAEKGLLWDAFLRLAVLAVRILYAWYKHEVTK